MQRALAFRLEWAAYIHPTISVQTRYTQRHLNIYTNGYPDRYMERQTHTCTGTLFWFNPITDPPLPFPVVSLPAVRKRGISSTNFALLSLSVHSPVRICSNFDNPRPVGPTRAHIFVNVLFSMDFSVRKCARILREI